jgi:hypothetical protein
VSHLFLSIATSSLFKPSLAEDSKQQPWICRIAAEFCDADGGVLDNFATGIRAEGRKISAEATEIHGITSMQAERGGIYEIFAIGAICGLKAGTKRGCDYPGFASNARCVIAWDAPFARTVIGSLFSRHGEPASAWIRPGLQFISLKEMASPFCRLPPRDGDDTGAPRWPSLQEAGALLLGEPETPLPHTVEENLARTKRLWTWLRDQRAFEVAA